MLPGVLRIPSFWLCISSQRHRCAHRGRILPSPAPARRRYLSDYFYPDELTAVANFATAGGLPVGSHLWELSNGHSHLVARPAATAAALVGFPAVAAGADIRMLPVIRGTPRDGKPWERGHLTLLTGPLPAHARTHAHMGTGLPLCLPAQQSAGPPQARMQRRHWRG